MKKGVIITICVLLVLAILGGLFLFFYPQNASFERVIGAKAEDVEMLRIRNGSNGEIAETSDPAVIKELFDGMKDVKFTKNVHPRYNGWSFIVEFHLKNGMTVEYDQGHSVMRYYHHNVFGRWDNIFGGIKESDWNKAYQTLDEFFQKLPDKTNIYQ